MPNYEVGAKSSIKLKAAGSTAAATPAAAAAAAPASSAWTLAADMDDELLDDETLLTEEDRQRPAAAGEGMQAAVHAPSDQQCGACVAGQLVECLLQRATTLQQSTTLHKPCATPAVADIGSCACTAAMDDCEVGASGRKACKNCTCGRADAEAKPVKLTQEMLDNPVSSCGNVSAQQHKLGWQQQQQQRGALSGTVVHGADCVQQERCYHVYGSASAPKRSVRKWDILVFGMDCCVPGGLHSRHTKS